MNIKIHSSELNRMMKTITQCIDPKSQSFGNIEVIYANNLLTIRGTNGMLSAVLSTPVLGGDGETFCVDGTIFARVCAMCSGEISIVTDGKVCTIKGAGRTRLPIINAKIPEFTSVSGSACSVRAEDLSRGYNSVAYAISTDQSRIVLTGVLFESNDNGAMMVALDGFKMAVETVPCDAHDMKVVIPGHFMKLLSYSTTPGESITIKTDRKRIQASTEGMTLSCRLLSDDFPDYKKLIPGSFKTESTVDAVSLQSALKSGSVVNTSNNLVKMNITEDSISVMSNSEQADFDADVSCATNGDEIKIAFNHKYLMDTIGSVNSEDIVMCFNSPISPCVIKSKDDGGFRLILPVRVVG